MIDRMATLRNGFRVTRACGPDNLYELSIKFQCLEDLDTADQELRDALERERIDLGPLTDAALSHPAPVAAPANEQLLEWLAKHADIEVSMVRADGKPMSKGERFAAGFVGDKDGLTAEWRITFNTDYGLHESEDDLRAAILATKGSKS